MDDTFDAQREILVAVQLVRRGIHDQRVLTAMATVPREVFIPLALIDNAYADCALPIGYEQTISQPYTVACMCQAAHLTGSERVLEVGTGSGFGAAVLGQLAREVHTIERIPELAHSAAQRLRDLGYDNVRVHLSDGSLGLSDEAPFDAIVVTAGAEELPPAFQQQLADGGRIVMPVGPYGEQRLMRFTRRGSNWQQEDLGGFGFVPLICGMDGDSQPSE